MRENDLITRDISMPLPESNGKFDDCLCPMKWRKLEMVIILGSIISFSFFGTLIEFTEIYGAFNILFSVGLSMFTCT